MTQNDIADRLDALEAQLDDQQKTIERQQERIEAQEAIINAQQKRLDADGGDADDSEEIDANGSDADGDDSERAVLNRRTALQAGGVLGLLGLGAGTASADASGQIGTSSDPLQQLYTEELNGGVTGDAQLTNIAGSNLSIDSSGNLNASGGGSGAWVEGDNTSLLEPVSKDGIEVDTIADNGSGSVTMNSALDLTDNQINYGTNAGSQTLADLPFGSSQRAGSVNSYTMQLDGDEVLTVGAQNDGSGNLSGAYVWAKKDLRLGGTLDARGGTIENTTGGLTVTTNDTGDLTLDPGANNELTLSNQTTGSSGSLLVIDGSGNVVEASGTTLSDVGGGGSSSSLVTSGSSVTAVEVIDGDTSVSASNDISTPPNVISGHPSNNTEDPNGAQSVRGVTIAGGGGDSGSSNDNTASADYTTIGGGYANTASGDNAVVAGGYSNTAGAIEATVGGGTLNSATSPAATVPGGRDNTADGFYSFAAGRKAEANGNNGAFVWGDSSSTTVTAGAADEVRFQATGGFVVENGNVDAQAGTVENTTGALSLSTGSDDLTLDPSGNIDLNSNRISNAKEIHSDSNNITFKGTADVNLDGTRLTEKGGDMNIISVNSVNVDIDSDSNDADGNRDFNVTKDGGATTLFTVNDGGQVDIFQGDLDMNSSGSVINTSDVRLKTAIEPIANPVEKLTALEPRTYEWKDDEAADGREAGVLAQSVEDTLPEAVKEDEDGFLKLAYSQLTPLVISAVQDQQDEIEDIESDLDDKDDRLDDLEAENEHLRERNAELEDRLAAVEAELGIDATASQQGVADD